MSPIGFFSRQAFHARNGERGQAAVLFLVVIGTVLSLVFASVVVQNAGVSRVACANAVDAVALNAATWEARCLNLIAALNDGVAQCLRLIRSISLIWAALAIAAAFGVGAPAFAEYTEYARKAIRGYWKTARELVEWSHKIRDAAPYLILGETTALAAARNVRGLLHPMDPRGPHDGENTIELHLEPGPPISLLDAMAPVSSALNRLRKIRFPKGAIKAVVSILNGVLAVILQDGGEPIRMLVPEKDFAERQFVRFTGSRGVPEIPIPWLGRRGKETVFAEALAEPYGGGTAEMTWKSRLAERSAK